MKNIRAILLAGGDSTRLWPVQDKHFLSILGKPLIIHSVSQLIKTGIEDIVIIVPKGKKEKFEYILTEFTSITIHLVEQLDERGMAGALLSAETYVLNREILVVSPADIYDDSLLVAFKEMLADKPTGVMAGVFRDTYFPGGYLTVDKGIVRGIVEKPDEMKVPSNIVNLVFYYFYNGTFLIEALKQANSDKDDVFELAIDSMIRNGFLFKFLPYSGHWGYIKYPWHVLSVMTYFLSMLKEEKNRHIEIDSTAIIEGPVVCGEGVQIMDHVKIIGPVYIGAGTIIGSHSMIRESMIGEHCVIGFNTDIARSYIGNHCWFHKNYIGDSVLSDNVCMGAGAVLANFRLDEKNIQSPIGSSTINTQRNKLGSMIGANVRIGVNASIMPGIKIGKNTFVGAGVILTEDLKENKYCVPGKNAYVIKNNIAFGLENSKRNIDGTLKKKK
jgi:NDP-sugar pyrophosphorylase family protein